jgi:hypothetical protein
VTLHADQLIITLILMIFLIYTYSLILGDFYSSNFVSEGKSEFCANVLGCFLYVITLGLKAGGGVADTMITQRYGIDEP